MDAAEQAWWARYAEVEERFCWVQPEWTQRILRDGYVRSIARSLPPGARVLELGCGTGWLCLRLAELTTAQIDGVDFSPEQVRRARDAARSRGLEGRIRFHLAGGEWAGAVAGAHFDALILHAALHHLSDAEALALFEQFSHDFARPEARVFVVEPVLSERLDARCRWLDYAADQLVLLPRFGKRRRLRTFSREELAASELVDSRGDSPKETPFLEGELEKLLPPSFQLEARSPLLCFSYLAAKNLLLMSLSHPVLAVRLGPWYLRLVRLFERVVLSFRPAGTRFPVFYLFRFRLDLSRHAALTEDLT